MRQKLTLLTKSLLLLCALMAGSGSAWAEDVTETITLSEQGYTNAQSVSSTQGTVVTLTYTDGNTGTAYYTTGTGVRVYYGGKMTVTANDYTISKVIVTFGKDKSPTIGWASDGTNTSTTTTSPATWQGTATSVDFTVSDKGHARIQSVAVTYAVDSGSGTNVAKPVFSPVGGEYTSSKDVTISTSTEGATIYYTMTTDGTTPDDPTTSSTAYTSAVPVTISGTIIKAKAFKSDFDPSDIATATYTIKSTTPTISALGATVTITGDDGCTFYYTTDGSAPTNSSTEYTGPFDLDASCTIKAIAYDAYGNASGVKTYTFKYLPLSPKNINSGYFEKVTDASTLENGDAILIVNEDASAAMSTTQNSNNRGTAEVTITDKVIYAPSNDVQKLILVKKTEEINNVDTEVFYFYTGEGYLYAASGSSNHLKTENTPDDNGNARATITISKGDATVTFAGTNSRNLMQYNSGSSLFSCYGSAQAAVQIYKEVAHNVPATITSAKYATFNSQFALDFSSTGITAYTATDGETKVTLNEITSGQVPANTPVVLYKAGADGTPINVPVIASADAPAGINDLHVVGEGGLTGEDNIYVLAKSPTVGFYLWDKTQTLKEGKIYLQGKASYDARQFLGFGEETSIESLKARKAAEGKCYNLNGQRVARPAKGLYIVNGKKVTVK